MVCNMNNNLSQIKHRVKCKKEKKNNLWSGVYSVMMHLCCTLFPYFSCSIVLCIHILQMFTGNEGSIAERVNKIFFSVYIIRIRAGHKHGLNKQKGENIKYC